MAAIQPPLYIGVNGEIGADELGLPWRDILGEGVVGSTDLAVAQRGAGANMSVDVGAGAAWVLGDDDVNAQPIYRVRNDATVNVAIAGADASKPRIDRIVARVYDSAFAGTSLTWAIEVVAGTPTVGATLTNLSGAAAVPNTALLLANVLVPAAAATVVTADISNARVVAVTDGGELAYDEITASVNVTGTSSGSSTSIIAGTSHYYDGTPVMVEFSTPLASLPRVAGEGLLVDLYDGSTLVARLAQANNAASAACDLPMVGKIRMTPSAGFHQYAVKAWVASTTGTPFIDGGTGTGGAYAPAYLRVTKV